MRRGFRVFFKRAVGEVFVEAGNTCIMSQCAAPQPTASEQVGDKTVVGAAATADDATSLRDSAVRLAEAGEVRAAIPLFQAAVALNPTEPQGHSDEGVSWMRLQEWEQARAQHFCALPQPHIGTPLCHLCAVGLGSLGPPSSVRSK